MWCGAGSIPGSIRLTESVRFNWQPAYRSDILIAMRFPIFIALIVLANVTFAANEDGSAPRAALLMYDKMVGPNEVDKALPLYYATSTREAALAEVLAKCDGALANLHKKATDKFGHTIADKLLHDVDATVTEDINAAKVEVKGDKAEVTFPDASSPVTMVRINGEWKISVKSLAQGIEDPRKFRKAFTQLAKLVNDVAEKIGGGQLGNPDDASKKLVEGYKAIFKKD